MTDPVGLDPRRAPVVDGPHVRTRRAKACLGLLAVAVAVALVAVLVGGGDEHHEHDGQAMGAPSTVASLTPLASAFEGRMVPASTVEGDEVVVPITTPDGRRFELRHPREIDIAALGMTTRVMVAWPVPPNFDGPRGCCSRDVSFTYSPVADLYPDAAPVAVYPGARDATVLLLRAAQRRSAPSPYDDADQLVYSFGRWTVEVWAEVPGSTNVTPLDDVQRRTWASALAARTDEHGFLVLEPAAPLRMGDLRTVQVTFGALGTGRSRLGLSPFYCGSNGSDTEVHRRFRDQISGGEGVAWCDTATGMHISATGPVEFVDAIDAGFVLRMLGG